MRTYRICPCSMFDIAGTQNWLEKQSAKGLHIDTAFSLRIVGFRKGEPRHIRYRMDAAPDWGKGAERGTPSPDEATFLSYQEMGWEYVSNRNHFHIYAAEDPAAPELHTDPRVQAMSMSLVSRRIFRTLLWTIPMSILWFIQLRTYDIYTSLIEGEALLSLISTLFWLTQIVQSGTEYLWVQLMRRSLSRGGTIRPFGTGRKITSMVLETLPFAMILLMFTIYLPSARDQAPQVSLQEYRQTLDLPMAESVLTGEQFTLKESTVTAWSTPGSPENTQLHQSFDLVLQDGKTLFGGWYVVRHETAASWIARGYAEECTAQDSRNAQNQTVEYLPLDADADYACAYKIHYAYWTTSPTIILCRGNTVLIAHLDFRGRAEPVDYRVLAELLGEYLG